ncbi:MAG: hypothetical protein JW820_05325 [Spirochaetales bacterium]|nr:hypothetical protein [Spirochaetales bacterium]
MGILRFFRQLTERAVLRSALELEEEVHGLYEAVDEELAEEPMPEELLRVLSEEREHKQILKNILEGRIPDDEAGLVLSKGRFHDLEQVRPLDRGAYGGVWDRLEHILKRETEIQLFFRGLCTKAKLPAVRRVLCFLAEEEDTHVNLLHRLLGGSPSRG